MGMPKCYTYPIPICYTPYTQMLQGVYLNVTPMRTQKKTPHHHDGELWLIGILYNLSNGTTTKVQQLFNITKLFGGKVKKSLLLVKILFIGQFFTNL
jgi:hypothetical protein